MSSRLFAFQVAKPLESLGHDAISAEYDSFNQTLIWQGSTRSLIGGVCTTQYVQGFPICNAYGDYCATHGTLGRRGYFCD